MDLKIGVVQTPKEIAVELPDGADPAKLKAAVEAVLSGKDSIFWVVDRSGREVGVPAERIAYIEIGSPDAGRRVGF
jgi:hypothetical protein